MPKLISQFYLPFLSFQKELRWFFISKLFRTLVESTAFLFFPLFLFKLVYDSEIILSSSLSSLQAGLLLVVFFYLLRRLIIGIIIFPIVSFIKKVGLRNAMVVGTILYALVMVCFALVEHVHIAFLFPGFLLHAVALPLYWIAYHTLFSRKMKTNTAGKSMGTLLFLSKLLQALSPMFSGFLILIGGFSYVFLFSIVCFMASAIALLKIHNDHVKDHISFKEFREWSKEKRFQKLSLSFTGRYMGDIILNNFWPIYIFLILGSLQKLGYLYSTVFFISLLLTYFSGWYLDHKKNKKPFYISGLVKSIILFIRSGIASIWTFVVVDIIDQLASSFYQPFFDGMFMRRSIGRESLSFQVYREIVISFFGVIVWSLLALVIVLIPHIWLGIFIFGGFGYMLSLFIDDKAKK